MVIPAAPAVDHLHHRRLAGPVGPEQAEARTLLDLEAQVMHGTEPAERLADVMHTNYFHAASITDLPGGCKAVPLLVQTVAVNDGRNRTAEGWPLFFSFQPIRNALDQARSVNHRHNEDSCRLDLVYDPITVNESFSDLLILQFRHDPSHPRKALDASSDLDDSRGHSPSVELGVSTDVLRDRFDVFDGLGRPDYFEVHSASRLSASS